MKYKFSVPMPFEKEHINKIININNQIEKSTIETMYFSLPGNSPDITGFEQTRTYNSKTTDFEYWKPLIEYTVKKGFNFIYLLNSPKVFNPKFDRIEKNLENLDKLLKNLRSLGCNKLRVCTPQLIEYLNENYPDFEIYLSTSVELQTIKQYSNFFYMFNNIKEFVPAFDLNKNFNFLKNIKKKFPNINIELMVNEGCIPGCPIRNSHNFYNFSNPCTSTTNIDTLSNGFEGGFFYNKCHLIKNRDLEFYICNCNVIYPWEIEEYSKIGINNFKLVGRNCDAFNSGKYINYYKTYLLGIDNIKNILDTPIRYFNHYIESNEEIFITVNEIKPYLPNIQHFIKHGSECATKCGVECRYCYKCAEKIHKLFIQNEEEKQKRTVPVCIMNG